VAAAPRLIEQATMTTRRRLAILLLAMFAAAAPGAEPAPSAQPNVRVLAPLAMPGLARERTLRLYLPPGYAQGGERRYPVIYMHDAQNLFDDATSYAGEWGVDETLNRLARSHGFEAIVVGIDNGQGLRINELSPWPNPRFGRAEGDAYLAFIVDIVKPFIDAHYRTRSDAASTAIIGSSLGGLISHAALLRYPQVFGKAAVFSPSYWFAPQVFDATRAAALPDTTRIYLYIGGGEGDDALPDTRRMHALLAQRLDANHLRLSIAPQAGHNEAAWRAEFGPAIEWLFELKP
jgi:predicted alpha/beta superfamily hydrolase